MLQFLYTNSPPSIPQFRHIIVHIDDELAACSPPSSDTLSTNPLAHPMETAAHHDDTEVTHFHSSEFDHLDREYLVPHLAKLVGDAVVIDSWACGTHPMVWIAPWSRWQANEALMVVMTLRDEFSEDALDITLLIEGEQIGRNRYIEPVWLRDAWVQYGRFAYCGTFGAVVSVLHYGTKARGASEKWSTTRAQEQRCPWAVKELRRPDIVRHSGGGGCYSIVTRKALLVDTIRFYDRDKPWYELTNFFQGAGFFWERTMEKFSTVEHFFQAMKTTDPTERVKIALAASARDALGIARNSTGMKWYWEQQCLCGDLFKERVMYMALMQKFSIEEPQLRTLLLSTGTCQLTEASRVDPYWGSGDDGKGKNRLGFLLEKVRAAILREECLGRRGYNYFESKFDELWH